MKRTHLLCGAAVLTVTHLALSQPTAHYVPGVEGIKGASLPPPGFYLRDYNVFYYSDRLNDPSGHEIPGLDPKAFIYANVPRLVWITPVEFLGGNLGVDGLLPLQYTDLKLNGVINDQTFGIGDFFAEGTWSSHLKQFDLSAGAGFWAPTGDSATGPTTRAGLGYWTVMLTAGATWYIDENKKWALSALNRYEINTQKDGTDITPGQAYTLEWGLSRNVIQNVDLGVVGYYQQQVTSDSGNGSTGNLDMVTGIGPEVTAFCPKLGLNTSLRYIYELVSKDRLQGQTVALTFTKRF